MRPEKLWALEVMLKGPAPEAPLKVTVLVAGVKEEMFQLPPTLMASEAVAVRAPAPERFAPTVRLNPLKLSVPAEMVRELVACTAEARVAPLATVRL